MFVYLKCYKNHFVTNEKFMFLNTYFLFIAKHFTISKLWYWNEIMTMFYDKFSEIRFKKGFLNFKFLKYIHYMEYKNIIHICIN